MAETTVKANKPQCGKLARRKTQILGFSLVHEWPPKGPCTKGESLGDLEGSSVGSHLVYRVVTSVHHVNLQCGLQITLERAEP